MSEHELHLGIEHHERDDTRQEADRARARRMHVETAHGGDASACRCNVTFDTDHDAVAVTAVEDVDGIPLAVNETRARITDATWTAPTDDGGNHAA